MLSPWVPLQKWANENAQDGDGRNSAYWNQIIFVRDDVVKALAKDYDDYCTIQRRAVVISSHVSKSVHLPVYRIELYGGTAFTMRNNFYDWKVSVESQKDVEADFMGVFDPNEEISHLYCEGFPREYVYGSYANNKCNFTIALHADNYQLFTFFWVYAHKVLGKV